jgi:phosphotransferase system enzyme I (PtsI)
VILLEGIAASPGIAIGKSLLKIEKEIEIDRENITEKQVEQEIEKLHTALEESKKSLEKLKDETAEKLGEEKAEIFAAYLMILDDTEVIPAFENKIKDNKLNAAAAVKDVINEFALCLQQWMMNI